MKIQYLGHACFKLITGENSLVIDPYADGSVPGLSPLREKATAVICSHQHADHSGTSCIELTDGDKFVFEIEEIASWHDDQQGALRGPNTIHVISCDNCRIAHLGDLGCALNEEQKAKLQNLDVLMIPVGGHFTIDAAQAAEIAKELAPKCVIPMHYRGEDFGYEVLGTVDQFTRNFAEASEVGSILEVDANMPTVAVMSFKN